MSFEYYPTILILTLYIFIRPQITQSVTMKTDEEFYPMWTTSEILINLDGASKNVEYKFVKIKGNDNFQSLDMETIWESGKNRVLDLSSYIISDKINHLSVETRAFNTSKQAEIHVLYDDVIKDESIETSIVNIDFEQILIGD